MTTAGGSRLTTSVGGTLTGRGGDLIIIDDPLKPQDAHSESARESQKQWLSGTLLSRLDHKSEGSIIVVMQRLHPDDLVGHLLEQGVGTSQPSRDRRDRLPYSARHQSLSPPARRRSSASGTRRPGYSRGLKRAMGSMEFAAQYQQAPVARDGNLIKWSWFKFYDTPPSLVLATA